MSRNYKFHNPAGGYFVSFAVVEWIDVFTRNKYKNIILDSLTYCQRENGMGIFAWCIMTNHVHLVFRPEDYIYSSAKDYSGGNGVLDDVVVCK